MKLQDFQISLAFGSVCVFMMLTSYLIYRQVCRQTFGSCGEWIKYAEPVGRSFGLIGYNSIPIIAGLFVYECIIAQI